MRIIGFFWTVLFVSCSLSIAQTQPDTLFFERERQIPFEGGDEIEVDNEGNIFVLNKSQNKIVKFLAKNNYDSTYSIGGMGTRGEGFLGLTEIKSKSRQIIYALDEAQRSIISLNTNLRLIQKMDFNTLGLEQNAEDILPISFDINEWGDIFILNGMDNRVYKWDAQSNTTQSFGGQDYGEGKLTHPCFLQIDDKNNIWIADTTSQLLSVYDVYGVFLYQINILQNKNKNIFGSFKNFHVIASDLFLFNHENIFLYSEIGNRFFSLAFLHSSKNTSHPYIRDFYRKKERVYLLFPSFVEIYLFKH